MTTGGRRARSVTCPAAQLLCPLVCLLAAGSALRGGWKPLCKAGCGIRSVFCPPTATAEKSIFLINTLWLMFSFSLVGWFVLKNCLFFLLQDPQLLGYFEAS